MHQVLHIKHLHSSIRVHLPIGAWMLRLHTLARERWMGMGFLTEDAGVLEKLWRGSADAASAMSGVACAVRLCVANECACSRVELVCAPHQQETERV